MRVICIIKLIEKCVTGLQLIKTYYWSSFHKMRGNVINSFNEAIYMYNYNKHDQAILNEKRYRDRKKQTGMGTIIVNYNDKN